MGNEAGEWIIHGVTWDDRNASTMWMKQSNISTGLVFFLFLRTKFRDFLWRNGQWQNIGGLMIR